MYPNQNTPQQPYNPYTAGQQFQNSPQPQYSQQNFGPQYPVICWIMFPLSLLFSLIRILLVGLGIVGYMMMMEMENPPVPMVTAIPEVITGILIVFFGLIGNGLMLARKPIGYYFGCGLVVSVVLSIVLGFVQYSLMDSQFAAGSPQSTGEMVGTIVAFFVRVGILVAYIFALVQFRKWSLQTQAI